eukprot:jgi/Chlat1/7635/Chrsp64S07163
MQLASALWGTPVVLQRRGAGAPRRHGDDDAAAAGRRRRRRSTTTCQAVAVGVSTTSTGTKLVTTLGAGGAGKSTAAVLLARYYASQGKRTCLVAGQGPDRGPDSLLGLASLPSPPAAAPVEVAPNLHALRLSTTKIAGEEFGVLPAVDTAVALGALESLVGVLGEDLGPLDMRVGGDVPRKYDVVVYDGSGNNDTLRLFGAPERTRWYVNRLKGLAEKTDAGRVLLPSARDAIERALGRSITAPDASARGPSALFERVDGILERAARFFADPARFAAYVVAGTGSPHHAATAHRLWGYATHAGIHVGGVLSFGGLGEGSPSFDPLAQIKLDSFDRVRADWAGAAEAMPGDLDELSFRSRPANTPFRIDLASRQVEVFLPGFDRSEVKLSQYRGNSELLIDAGDQRRNIILPPSMRGKVKAAKFSSNTLVITIGPAK